MCSTCKTSYYCKSIVPVELLNSEALHRLHWENKVRFKILKFTVLYVPIFNVVSFAFLESILFIITILQSPEQPSHPYYPSSLFHHHDLRCLQLKPDHQLVIVIDNVNFDYNITHMFEGALKILLKRQEG